MKAILEYNLPEDENEFRLAMDSSNMLSCLIELELELRNIYKHEDLKENQFELIDKIRTTFYEILESNQIKIN